MSVLFKKKGVFTGDDARKVIGEMAKYPEEGELIVMAEVVTEEAKRRLWDYAKAVKLMADMSGDEREIRIEILEGYVSEKVKGTDVDTL